MTVCIGNFLLSKALQVEALERIKAQALRVEVDDNQLALSWEDRIVGDLEHIGDTVQTMLSSVTVQIREVGCLLGMLHPNVGSHG